MLHDGSTLVLKERLLTVNLCLRTMWSCTAVIMKPWTARINIERKVEGSVPTSTIPGIAELNAATSKMDKLLKSPNKLFAIHGTGGVVTQGPPQPTMPNVEITMSTEVDTYLQAVLELDTAAGAAAIWRPGSSKPDQLKQLQPRPRHGKGNGGHNGGCKGFKGRGRRGLGG